MPRFFALVPAAGTGSRFGHDVPKQYLPLAGRAMLAHAVSALAAHPLIERVCVVLAPGDTRFHGIDWGAAAAKVEPLFCGGPSRASTVYNGLIAIADDAEGDDWILVHDAARPCLSIGVLTGLIMELAEHPTGGLLAVPVADTLKRANDAGEVAATESRTQLWQAQTPQMFRFQILLRALRGADHAVLTDESSAVERLGLRPCLVMGDSQNIKVTLSQDLEVAELILKNREAADRRTLPRRA
jgi:2-C-methyl-D-erythritol 4-phosphate cytidylyltransferase